ncbi:acyl-CoA-binding protein [Hymenobacter sp. BT507]|uniref:Acyl-CoA-binding protein n=1 Tax=Hymenobacter citatus TaxID=2763506 RepID=A0ABR7MKM2_9BACT|nr:acyl-CoA-binding protein [Hymenobacter citatus]MBC6611633.1 acyl-CoA-binding protein [Hymenobacter citatus]
MNLQEQMSLQKQFEVAITRVDGLPAEKGAEYMTDLYGLYKQATDGDHDTKHDEVDTDDHDNPDGPAGLSQAQWDSWSKYKGMPEEEAKRQYVALVEKIAGPVGEAANIITGNGQPATATQVNSAGTARVDDPQPGKSAPGGLQGNLDGGAPYGGEDDLKLEQ